jgi:hypothetical protein
MPPANLIEEIPSDRQQTVASSNHKFSLVLQEQEGPFLNPVCSHHMDNLQEVIDTNIFKDNIILTSAYRPTQSKCSISYSCFSFLVNLI